MVHFLHFLTTGYSPCQSCQVWLGVVQQECSKLDGKSLAMVSPGVVQRECPQLHGKTLGMVSLVVVLQECLEASNLVNLAFQAAVLQGCLLLGTNPPLALLVVGQQVSPFPQSTQEMLESLEELLQASLLLGNCPVQG